MNKKDIDIFLSKAEEVLKPSDFKKILKIAEETFGEYINLKNENEKEEAIEIAKTINLIIEKSDNLAKKPISIRKNSIGIKKISACSKRFKKEDIVLTYLYFSRIWNTNDMQKYIRPQTIFKKFEERKAEAVMEIKALLQGIEEIEKTLKFYIAEKRRLLFLDDPQDQELLNFFIDQKKLQEHVQFYEFGFPFVDLIEFNTYKKILFWKEKFEEEIFFYTIFKTIESWKKKPDLVPHISLANILNEKFPERIKVAQRIKAKEVLSSSNKGAVSFLSDKKDELPLVSFLS